MSSGLHGQKVIGRTTGRMNRSCCAVVKVNRGHTLSVGDTIRFLREGGGLTEDLFHDSTHEVGSIQVDDVSVHSVGSEDGICSVKINSLPVPPRNCTVYLVDTRKPDDLD